MPSREIRLPMPAHAPLDNVSIVLVRTKTPANIGAVARGMKNTGLSRLLLVQQPSDQAGDAEKLAAGAAEIVRSAAQFDTLAEAIAGHQLVVGTSRHSGRLRKNIATPRAAAARIAPLLGRNRVAVVFGREVNGLDRKDLALCHEIISIPSHREFPSLNLSHAFMIVAYELFLASLGQEAASLSASELASSTELEQFFRHLEETLRDIGFFHEEKAERIMLTLRQIFGRARLEPRDVAILRGILSRIDQPLGRRNR